MKSFLESKRWHHQSTFLPAIFPIKETKFEITLIHFPVKFPKRYFHRLWFDVFSAEKTFQSFYIGSKIHTNFHFFGRGGPFPYSSDSIKSQTLLCSNIQGDFFNWASPENVSRLAPPKFAWTGPPLIF